MAAPAEMAHADEALKSLVARFREAPGSAAFTDLAAALLARGHAAEALRIAEHGLQLVPTSVEGRVERAAALLALGRPRVAYVELKRALAISPTNRRAMRLLGKVYIDAGAPGRAAELLAQRSRNEHAEEETTHVTPTPYGFGEDSPTANMDSRQAIAVRAELATLPRRPHVPAPPPALDVPAPEDATPAFPDLFSDLTRDLGLSVAAPERPQSRVEVTQVIRRRGGAPGRSPSELEAIEGPIIDTTQPGQISEISGDLGAPPLGLEPAPLFDAVTSPRMTLSSISLDDEPLFQENMPFAVRPVESAGELGEQPSDLRETIDEEHPPELDPGLMNALDADTANMDLASPLETQGNTQVDEIELQLTPREGLSSELPRSEPPPLHDGLRENRAEREQERARELREQERERELREQERARDLREQERARDLREQERARGHEREKERPAVAELHGDAPPFRAPPLLEIARPTRRSQQPPRLDLVEPPTKPGHMILALVVLLLMAAYVALLAYQVPDTWKQGLSGVDNAVRNGEPSASGSSSGASEEARAF